MPIEGLPKKYIIAAAAAVFVVLAAVFMAQLKPVDATAVTTKTFSVQSGDGFSKIANNLSAQGFIRSRVAFEFFLFADGTASSLRPGIYKLSPAMSAPAIARMLAMGNGDITGDNSGRIQRVSD